ncbi:hypothetical protein EXS70_03640 [Candidatus Peribacteria bacterium]|nr:hypothetical protein [Candidatus Peribacteria bacterium]
MGIEIIIVAVFIFLIVSFIPYRRKAKDVIFRNQKAKKFFVRPFVSKASLPYSIYTTEDGIWIGRFHQFFCAYSDLQSAAKGSIFCCLKSKNGPYLTMPFLFAIYGGQKEEFFEILRQKGVNVQ